MTTAQVVEMSVTMRINRLGLNSPIQDYLHPDGSPQPTYEMSPGPGCIKRP